MTKIPQHGQGDLRSDSSTCIYFQLRLCDSWGCKESGTTEQLNWLTDCLWLVRVLAVQSCPTLCDPMDCSPPGSSVHGILQAKILEWVVIPFSRASSWPRDLTRVFHIADKFFTIWATRWDPQTSQLGQAFCFKLLCKSTIYAAGGGENWAKMSKKFTTTCFSVFLFGLGCSLISCLLVL